MDILQNIDWFCIEKVTENESVRSIHIGIWLKKIASRLRDDLAALRAPAGKILTIFHRQL